MCSGSSSEPGSRWRRSRPRWRLAGTFGLGLLLLGCATTPAARPAGHAPRTTSSTVPPTTTTEDPGVLPQTDAVPAPDTAHFDTAMAALWSGVVTGSLDAAMPAFFPESAYLQVKTVADPAADFEQRLVAEYAADLTAAHQLLGTGASNASLVSVQVPARYVHWVPPGVCANRVGYWEVGQSRLVYRSAGTVRSFGIASLISWRGEWYVVHLGAVLRSGTGGVVDDPEPGPGTSPPSSSC